MTTNESQPFAASASSPQSATTMFHQPHRLQISPMDKIDVPTAYAHPATEEIQVHEESQGNLQARDGLRFSKSGGHMHDCHCATCFIKLKQVNVQLQAQLEAVQLRYYEYCGRWTLACARVHQLEGRLASAGISIP
ncbi:hypothetical protein B0H21DRAFT_895299, partial [Amylocystis lapponica]